MKVMHAKHIMESLRLGTPPDGFVKQFTVGRQEEINDLVHRLHDGEGTVLLINANYGSGKTHLLRYISEEALNLNYIVSNVTIDSNSGVRFNRMDQIFGAVCRNIRLPQKPGGTGFRHFFDFLMEPTNENNIFWDEMSNYGRWDYSEVLDAPAVFIALRAWIFCNADTRDLIEDWFYNPEAYRVQRQKLYGELISNLRKYFRDPRYQQKFYDDGIFVFNLRGYDQCWAALRDFNHLAQRFGFKGMIVLFDEFEDILTNLGNIAYQEAAFWNLFEFYSGKKYPGKTFYAVTPAFIVKCKQRLLEKGRWDFDYSRFEKLPQYEMSPLETEHLEELSLRILVTHGIAYDWEPDLVMKYSQLKRLVNEAAQMQMQDRARHVIKTVVAKLDELLEE